MRLNRATPMLALIAALILPGLADGQPRRMTAADLAAAGGATLDSDGTVSGRISKATGGSVARSLADRAADAPMLPDYVTNAAAGVVNVGPTLISTISAVRDMTLPRGTYRISTSGTIPAGTRLRFLPGAMLSVDSGVTLTIRGTVQAPPGVQIFGGAGTVTGVRDGWVEWWGAVGNWNGSTGTDDLPAFNRAEASIENSAGSDGGRATLRLAAKQYRLAGDFIVSPSLNFPISVVGTGYLTSDTRLIFTAGYNGFYVRGTKLASDLNRLADYHLSRFYAGCAGGLTGMTIGTNGFSLDGINKSRLDDVMIEGCPNNLAITDTRQIEFNRLKLSSSTGGTTNLKVFNSASGGFVGDLIFNNAEFVSINDATASNANFTSLTGGIRGVRFNHGTFYRGGADVSDGSATGASFSFGAGGTGGIGDVWFDDACQWDGFGGTAVDLNTFSSGALLENFHFIHAYINAFNQAFLIHSSNNTGTIAEIYIESPWLAYMPSSPIGIYWGRNITVNYPMMKQVGKLSPIIAAIDIASGPDINVTGARLRQVDGQVAVQYLIRAQGTSDRLVLRDNTGQTSAGTGTGILNGSITSSGQSQTISGNLAGP